MLAHDHADDQAVFRVQGHVVPAVAAAVLAGGAVLLLLDDEGPLLIERDLPGRRGSHEFLVAPPGVADDRVFIDADETSGLSDAAPLLQVLQDGEVRS